MSRCLSLVLGWYLVDVVAPYFQTPSFTFQFDCQHDSVDPFKIDKNIYFFITFAYLETTWSPSGASRVTIELPAGLQECPAGPREASKRSPRASRRSPKSPKGHQDCPEGAQELAKSVQIAARKPAVLKSNASSCSDPLMIRVRLNVSGKAAFCNTTALRDLQKPLPVAVGTTAPRFVS